MLGVAEDTERKGVPWSVSDDGRDASVTPMYFLIVRVQKVGFSGPRRLDEA